MFKVLGKQRQFPPNDNQRLYSISPHQNYINPNSKTLVHIVNPSFIIRSKVVQTHACNKIMSTCVDTLSTCVEFFMYLCIMEMELKGIRRVAKKSPTKRLVDIDNGEVMDVMEDDRFITIDSLPFVKVYSDEYGRCIYGLPYVGFQLLSYIMLKVERNSNLVYIDYTDVKNLIGNLSRSGYYKGVKELIKRNVVEQSERKHIYRVNPNLVYNGVRISKSK